MKQETLAEYQARGGQIIRCPDVTGEKSLANQRGTDKFPGKALIKLTTREREIVTLLGYGLSR